MVGLGYMVAQGVDQLSTLWGTMQSIAVRPFMLDSALSFVQPPSLEHRVKKEEAKSTFSRMFTWGGKK